MVELLQSKSIMIVIVLVLGVSFISANNSTTLDDEKTQIQINA